ncbi:MAG: hypothetical protein ACUVRK_13555 [Spirochaetota bacterium]
MTVSYYAKMVLQAFKDKYGNDIKAGVPMPVDILNDIPQSERHAVLDELVSKLEFIEMIEPRFPGKIFLTHKGYHYIQKIKE